MRTGMLVLISLFLFSALPGSSSAQAIIQAVREGNEVEVRRLLGEDSGAVHATDNRQCTPLHFAANEGNVALVNLLLDSGARLDVQDEDGDAPLSWAAAAGHLQALEILLARGADPDAENLGGGVALHFAATRGHSALVEALLAHGAELNTQDQEGHNALHRAGMRGQDAVLALLLSHDPDLELRDDYGRTPLLLVARESGSEAAARALLESGANPDAVDRFGASSLNLAAWRGFEGVVDALLDHDVDLDVDGREAGATTEFAAQKGLERLFRHLVGAGADLGIRPGNGGSLLHSAAEGGSGEIVGILLDRGFDATEGDRYGWTPLHYAAERGREEVSEVLIARGADVNAASVGGHTPLSVTYTFEKEAEARLLEARGATRERAAGMRRDGPWLGQETPGAEPVVFARDVVSSNRFEHGTVTFSPDGREAFWVSSFTPNETGYGYGRILTSRLEDGGWTQPEYAFFSSDFRTNDDVPFFSPDGEKLYFISRRPQEGVDRGGNERIWVVERTATGWGDPERIQGGPNTIGMHWQFSVAANGNIYIGSGDPGGFGGGDIYLSRFVDGAYQHPQNLGPVINTEAGENSPFIAPDESYLIFTGMDLPDTMGGTDLYISFRDPGGAWTPPLNMGEPINTSTNDMCPMVTTDGRFLFWNSRPEGNSDNYWMDAGIIEELRARALGGDSGETSTGG